MWGNFSARINRGAIKSGQRKDVSSRERERRSLVKMRERQSDEIEKGINLNIRNNRWNVMHEIVFNILSYRDTKLFLWQIIAILISNNVST